MAEDRNRITKYRRPVNLNIGMVIFAVIFIYVVICVIMYFHERGTSPPPDDTDTLLKLGDKVLFGTYLEEPIEWRVIQLGEDGAAVLISEYILTMKAFSAADSGSFNYDDDGNSYWSVGETEADRDLALQAYVRGSSSWVQSDLRIWLNSDKENVVYDGIGPVAGAMCNAAPVRQLYKTCPNPAQSPFPFGTKKSNIRIY